MTWLLPELDEGEEPELRPLEELELEPVLLEPVLLDPVLLDPFELEPELVELEPVELEPELVEPELVPLELVPEELEPVEPVEVEPELVEPVEVEALAVFAEPGRTRANAPAAATLATVTAVVAVLTLPRPRSRAATARRIPSLFVFLMSISLRSRRPDSLRESSPYPLSMALDLFAGIPVTSYAAALPWFERFFGGPPSFLPNDIEAVWEMSEHRYIYIVQAPERAGNALVLSFVDDLDDRVARIAQQGIEPARRETYDNGVAKVTYRDPEGNEISFGGRVS